MSLFSIWIRWVFGSGDEKRDRGLTPPPGVEYRKDLAYGPDPRWQKLDICRPEGSPDDLPVIVSVHGGAWVYGDKERYRWYCMELARRGFTVVNFTYRLAPEFKYPAGIEDTVSVFRWVLENVPGLAPERVFAVGDSAGAHMLTQFAAMCVNPAYAEKFGFDMPRWPDGRPFVPAALGLNCGVYRVERTRRGRGSLMNRLMLRTLMPRHGTAEELERFNPVPYVRPGFPRCLVMTANSDTLAGPPAQAELTAKLTACGVPFVDRTYGTEEAPLGHVFHCDVRSEAAARFNDDECRFFLDG